MKELVKKLWKEWAVLPFLMAVFALICFLLVFAMMMSMVEPPVARTMVLLLPALILAGFGVLANLLHFPLGVIWGVTILLTAVLGVWGFRETFFVALEAFTTTTTDIRYYERAYDSIDHEEYLDGIETIAECVVIGRKAQDSDEVILTVVAYPNFEKLPAGATEELIHETIYKQIMQINRRLPSFKQMKALELRATEFEKTTSKKIKRHLIK